MIEPRKPIDVTPCGTPVYASTGGTYKLTDEDKQRLQAYTEKTARDPNDFDRFWGWHQELVDIVNQESGA